ncbi:MAG: DUF2807 domain-containing protein [Flavobacteriales bacterium]|nr:DUF2807 domain-containing protein [Flavobacteriales bacterium]
MLRSLSWAITCPLLLTACFRMDCVEGKGPAVTRELSVAPISGVVTEGSINVEITQGSVQHVEAEGPGAVLDLISTTVNGGVWKVTTDGCFDSDVDVVVRITLPSLGEVGVAGSGDVRSVAPFSGEKLRITVQGSGDVDLPLSYQDVDVDIQGSGDVALRGTASALHVSIAGSGSVEALELSTTRSEVEIMGSGNVSVTAIGELDADIMGSGSVRYRGTPQVSSEIHGSGSVIPAP